MELLNRENIDDELSELSKGWKTDDYIRIEKEFFFNDFQEALNFTNNVGAYSEEIPHHPEIILSYGQAIVTISTHDLGGLSELDFQLAKKIDRLKLDKESLEIYENIEIAKTGNDFERRRAVGRLGNIGDIRSLPILIKSLNDKDPFVRRLSASSLGKIGSKKAVYPLATKLNQDDDGLSYAARDALINIGKPSVKELLNRIKNKNTVTRRRATIALGEIGDKDSIPYLIPLLQDDDDGVRWRAAKYIGISWNNSAIDQLKKLAKSDKSGKVKEEATKTLKKISNDVKNLLPIFEKGINAISEKITSKVMKGGSKQFYTNNKPFLDLITYNPYNNRVYLFRGNKRIEGVTPMKGNQKWGVITFQNKNELNIVLEAAKESYLLKKEVE
ncbi:MAG: HEAT repeat domain-containing protein [Methanobacterium sp.]